MKDNKNTTDTADIKGGTNSLSPKLEEQFPKPRSKSAIQASKRKASGGKNHEENTLSVSFVKSTASEGDIEMVDDATVVLRREQSQSAKSSPQKQLKDLKRQRAHSDTSLNKVIFLVHL